MKLKPSVPRPSEFDGKGNRRSLREYTARLTDYLNVQYLGGMYIGKSYQTLDLLFDTQSDMTWVPYEKCVTCPHKTFDTGGSIGSYFKNTKKGETEYTF